MIDLGTGNNNKMCVFCPLPFRRLTVCLETGPWITSKRSGCPRLLGCVYSLSLAYRHHRDGVPRGLERTWSRRLAQGSVRLPSVAVSLTWSDRLLDSVQILAVVVRAGVYASSMT